MTTRQTTRTEQLDKLTKKREEAHIEVQKLKRSRDEYEAEFEGMRGELTARRTTHPWEHESDGVTAKAGTETADLAAKIKARMIGAYLAPYPGQDKLDAAIEKYQQAELAEHRFKLENIDALTREITASAETAAAKFREGWNLVTEAAGDYLAAQNNLRTFLTDTPPFNGQSLAVDPVASRWEQQAKSALDHDLTPPRLTDRARDQLTLALAAFELERTNG